MCSIKFVIKFGVFRPLFPQTFFLSLSLLLPSQREYTVYTTHAWGCSVSLKGLVHFFIFLHPSPEQDNLNWPTFKFTAIFSFTWAIFSFQSCPFNSTINIIKTYLFIFVDAVLEWKISFSFFSWIFLCMASFNSIINNNNIFSYLPRKSSMGFLRDSLIFLSFYTYYNYSLKTKYSGHVM